MAEEDFSWLYDEPAPTPPPAVPVAQARAEAMEEAIPEEDFSWLYGDEVPVDAVPVDAVPIDAVPEEEPQEAVAGPPSDEGGEDFSWLYGDTAGPPIQAPPAEDDFEAPPDPSPFPAQPLSDSELDRAFGLSADAGLSMEGIIPGFSPGATAAESLLPASLSEEVPSTISGDKKGRLKGDDLRREWAKTQYIYKKSITPEKRLEAVGEFVHKWRPELAERAGWSPDGYQEPEGLFWLFDWIDKIGPRPIRSLARSLRELEVQEAASEISGTESPSFDDALKIISKKYDEDKGEPVHGEELLRDALLYFGGSDDPEEVLNEEAAKNRGESWADKALDSSAEELTRFGYEVAKHPIISGALGGAAGLGIFGPLAAAAGGVAGGIGGAYFGAGVDSDVYDAAKEEAVAAGSEGGHFAQGLIALMLFDPLNFISLGKFRGATDSAKDLIEKGMGVTLKGDEVTSAEAISYQRAGRQQFVQELLEEAPESVEAATIGRLSNQLDRAEEALDSATRSVRLREGLSEAAAARGADDLDVFDDVRSASQENAVVAQEAFDSIRQQFDDAVESFTGDLPAVARTAEQAQLIAKSDLQRAAITAFNIGAELRGSFAPALLASLREKAALLGVGTDEAQKAWQAGLRAADDQRLILVGFEDVAGTAIGTMKAKPILKDVGASRVYEMAKRGELGVDARVAAERPQYNALEKIIDKRSGKSFKELSDELTDVSYRPKEGVGRFVDPTYIPRKILESTKGAGELQAIRGEAQKIKRLLGDPKVKGAARSGLKKRLKDLKEMGKQASSKKGLSREFRLLQEERLVDDLNPLSMTITRKILDMAPWLDPPRQFLQTIGRGTLSRTGQRPQFYTKTGPDGKRVLRDKNEMVYPPAHYHVELLEQARHRARSLGKVMWPSIRAKLLTITEDEEMLRVAREFVELGYAAPLKGVKGAEQLVAAITIRELNKVLDRITQEGTRGTIRGKGYQMLSPEETKRAINAIDTLASTHPEMDTSNLRAAIEEYGETTAGILRERENKDLWAPGGDLDNARRNRLNETRLELAMFEGAYNKIVTEKFLIGAELDAAEKAERLRPELERLQSEVHRINELLGSKEVTSEQAMDDLIETLLREAEDMPGVNLNRDELIPIAIPRKPEYLEVAKGLESEELVAHKVLLRDQIAEMFDEAAANTVMDVMDRWAQVALEQGKVTRKDEWYQQVTGIYDVKTAFSEAMGPAMLFHEYEAAPIFYSQLYRSLEKVGVPEKVSLNTLVDNLVSSGVSQSTIDELDLTGWVQRKLDDIGESFDESYRGPPEKQAGIKERSLEKATVRPSEIKTYIESTGHESGDILNRLVGGDVSVKRLREVIRNLGVEVENTGFAELLVDEIKALLGPKKLDEFEDLVANSKYGLADALESPLVQGITLPRERLLGWVDTFKTQVEDDVLGYFSGRGNMKRRLGGRGGLVPWKDLAEEVLGRSVLVDDYIGGPSRRLDEYMEANPLGPRDELLDSITYTPDDTGPVMLEEAGDYTIESLLPNREKGVFEVDIEFAAPVGSEFAQYDEPLKLIVKREIDPEELGVSEDLFLDFAKHYDVKTRGRTDQSYLGESKQKIPYADASPFSVDLDLTTPGLEKYTAWPIINTGPTASGVTTAKSKQHFPGLKDIIAHFRFGVRTGPGGKRWLHVEEIQSDTAQGLNKAKRAEKAKVKRRKIFGRPYTESSWLPKKEEFWVDFDDLIYDEGSLHIPRVEEALSRLDEARELIGGGEFRALSSDMPTFNRYGKKLFEGLSKVEAEFGGLTHVEMEEIADDIVAVVGRIRDKLDSQIDVSPGISADTKIPYEKGWIDLAIKRLVAFAVDEADEPIHGIAWTTGDVQSNRYLGIAEEALASQYDVAMPARFKRLYGKETGGIEVKDFSFKVSDSVVDELEAAGDVRLSLDRFIEELRGRDTYGPDGFVEDPSEIIWYIYKNLGEEGRRRYGVKDVDFSLKRNFILSQAADALLNSKIAKIPVKDIDFGSEVHGFEITPKLKEHVRKGQALHHLKDKVVRGAMKLEEEGRVSIHAFESATVGTLVHEMGHVLRRNLQDGELKTVKDWLVGESSRLSKLPREELSKDIAHLFEAEGVVRVVDNKGNFTREGEEIFARGFERYLMGDPPRGVSGAVLKAFEKMKEWLTEIYKTVTGNDVEVSPEIRQVFDRYIAGKEQPKVAAKESWQIKRVDVGAKPGQTMEEALEIHRGQVKAAIDRGDDVPVEVLMDYEDLLLDIANKAINRGKGATKDAGKRLNKAARQMRKITDEPAPTVGGDGLSIAEVQKRDSAAARAATEALDTAKQGVLDAEAALSKAVRDSQAATASLDEAGSAPAKYFDEELAPYVQSSSPISKARYGQLGDWATIHEFLGFLFAHVSGGKVGIQNFTPEMAFRLVDQSIERGGFKRAHKETSGRFVKLREVSKYTRKDSDELDMHLRRAPWDEAPTTTEAQKLIKDLFILLQKRAQGATRYDPEGPPPFSKIEAKYKELKALEGTEALAGGAAPSKAAVSGEVKAAEAALEAARGRVTAAEEAGRTAPAPTEGVVSRKRAGNLDIARENVRKALSIIRRASKDKKFSTAAKQLEAVKALKAGEELAVKAGSRERHLLEALKAKYEDQTGELLQTIDSSRVAARTNARRAAYMLTRGILRGEQTLAPGEGRAQLEQAIDLVLSQFGKGADPLDVLQKGVTKGLVQRATMALPERIVAVEKRISDLEIKIDEKATKGLKRQLANQKRKLATLREQAQPIKDQIVVGEGDQGTELGNAIRELRAQEKATNRELGGVEPTVKAVTDQLSDIEGSLDRLAKFAEGMDYDFRLPADIRREIYSAKQAYLNNIEAHRMNYDGAMQAFREAETSRAMLNMTDDEMRVVKRLVKDPSLHDLTAGKEKLLKKARAEKARLAASIARLKDSGKDTSKQEAALDSARRRVDILEDEGMTKDVIQAANLIKAFFDDWLKKLKENGVLDKDFDEEAFFDRVDIAGYIPHVTTVTTRRKIEALRGKGMLPKRGEPGFAKKRKIAGTIDEINAQARVGVAESIAYHLASTGRWGEEAAEASKLAGDQLKEVLKKNGIEWNKLIDEIKSDAGLDDIFEFFETDPMVLMERYNNSASELIAGNKFIEDVLDVWPLGRELGDMYGKYADARALSLGYERLSSIDQLQVVMGKKLPPQLRNFESLIKQQLAEGVPLNEIVDDLIAKGVSAELISPDIVQGFAAKQWYVPSSVAEYLRYMNKPDKFLGLAADHKFVQVFDGIQSWMKMMATISASAHLGRNWIGNVISPIQEMGLGALDPESQFAAMMIWGSWSDKHLGKTLEFAGRKMTIEEWREFWQVRGVYDSPVSSEFIRETMGVQGPKEVPTIERLAKQLGGAGAGAALGGVVAGPAGAFIGGLGGAFITAKPFRNRAWTSFVDDISDAVEAGPKQAIPAIGQHVSGVGTGAVIGSAIAPGVGTAIGAAIGGLSFPDYIKMMSGLNQSIEAQARVSMAMSLLKRGETPEAARAAVNRALRNYSDLNPWERSVMRRVFFFYTWDAGNIRFQLRQLRRKPRAAKVVASFGNGVYKGQFSEEEINALPEHLRWRVLFRTGATKLIALSGLPHEPAIEILSRGKHGIPTGLVSRVRPDVLTFFEWAIGGGKSTYYGKQWEQINNVRSLKNAPPLLKAMVGFPEDGETLRVPIYKNGRKTGKYRTEYRARNPRLMYLMQRVPGYRVINEYMKIVTDTYQSFAMDQGDDTLAATGSERFWAFAFGQKPTTIDWDGQIQYMAYQLEERLLEIIDNENPRAVKQIKALSPTWTGPAEPVAQ